jgi:catechol 2,3-dioxygenase-like lactoylglutathione lyase family enzyme
VPAPSKEGYGIAIVTEVTKHAVDVTCAGNTANAQCRAHDRLEDGMADQSPFSTGIIHHIALRVGDVEAGKKWLTTMLGFRVQREFQVADRDFAFLSPDGAEAPVIELVGGPVDEHQIPENIPDMMKLAGWHHLCLQVRNVEQCISDLRRRGVKILIDVTDATPGIGVEKVAFVADPWGNIYELLQLAKEEKPIVR